MNKNLKHNKTILPESNLKNSSRKQSLVGEVFNMIPDLRMMEKIRLFKAQKAPGLNFKIGAFPALTIIPVYYTLINLKTLKPWEN